MNAPVSQRFISKLTPTSERTRGLAWVLVWLLVAGAAFAVGRLVGTPTNKISPLLILAGLFATFAVIIWYNLGRFEYGVLAMLLAGGLLNFASIPTGTDSKVVFSLVIGLLLLVIWVARALLNQVPLLRPSPVNAPLLAFMAVNFISLGWYYAMKDETLLAWSKFPVAQIGALILNCVLPLMLLMVASNIREIKWLRWMVGILIFLSAFNVVGKQFNLPTDVMIENGGKGLFVMWGGILVYAQLIMNNEISLLRKGQLVVVIVLLLYYYAVRQTGWLSGWLPMGIGIAVVTALHSRKLFLVFCVACVLFLALRFDQIYGSVVQSNVDEGSTTRLDLWRMNLEHVANHPLFGMGPAGYAPYNMYYHPLDARSTHNNYFDVLAQTGIVGSAIFLWFLFRLAKVGWQSRAAFKGKRNFEEMFATATLGGLAGVVIGMALGDWVLPFAYNQTISGFDNAVFTWVFLGGMVSLYFIARRAKTNTYIG